MKQNENKCKYLLETTAGADIPLQDETLVDNPAQYEKKGSRAMLYEMIDLYEHFGQKRPKDSKGYLRCMCLDPIDQVNPKRRYPALLIIPGGAYARVSEREAEPMAFGYMRMGYSVFCLDYSVAPNAFPVALREAVMAMLYIRENWDYLHIDPTKVSALGCSAGGHLCCSLATLFDCKEVSDLLEGSRCTARPDACIFCYPVITTGEKTHERSAANISGGDRELREFLSLEKRIRPDTPPAFIWHTRTDEAVPVANSLLLASAYEAADIPFELHIYAKGIHGMSVGYDTVYRTDAVPECSADMPGWLDLSARWLRETGMTITD